MLSIQIEYIRAESNPKDGKLLAIGHSMGGILLCALLSRCGKVPYPVLVLFAFVSDGTTLLTGLPYSILVLWVSF